MTAAIAVFCCQFAYIFLLGMQQQNVIHRRYVGAASVSLLLGIGGYYLTATIALAASQGFGSPVWWGYILSGPAGIVTAMWVHPRLNKPRHFDGVSECDKCRVHRNQLFYSRHSRSNGKCE